MRKIGIILLYVSGTLTFVGGLGDQFINGFLEVHLRFLGNPEPSTWLQQAEKLSMLMLHSAGGGLMSTGLSILALNHFSVRKHQIWSIWTIIVIASVAHGINGYGMFMAGSYFLYPVVVLSLTIIGALLVKVSSTTG